MEDLIQSWKENRKADYQDSLEFLKVLKDVQKKDRTISDLNTLHNEVFEEIDCVKCANCCKTAPPILERSDIGPLAKHMEISKKQFIKKYVLEDLTGELTMNGVPCQFLAESGECTVYDIRPKACRQFPHTDETAYIHRAKMNAQNTIVCPAAYHILDRLKQL